MGRSAHKAIVDNKKWCPQCEDFVLLSIFSKDSKSKDGYQAYCKSCRASARKVYYKENGQRLIDSQLVYNYGISSEEYQELWEKQKGLCASCGYPETLVRFEKIVRLAVDHCHSTGKIRGLLCSNCNRAIGLMNEDPERIKSLLRYTQERCLKE